MIELYNNKIRKYKNIRQNYIIIKQENIKNKEKIKK